MQRNCGSWPLRPAVNAPFASPQLTIAPHKTRTTQKHIQTGDNSRGQLGVTNAQAVAAPQAIQTVGRWAAVAISDHHAAGLAGGGQLFTWGSNNRGQLGHGDKCPGAIDAPVQVAALGDCEVK